MFKVQYDQCPCQVKRQLQIDFIFTQLDPFLKNDCPLGCPCDSFDCQPDKKSVLVLNTESSKNKPKLIKFDGEFDYKSLMIYFNDSGGAQENFDFTMGPDTSARSSCSATLNGEMFVFGGNGSSQNKQVIFLNIKKEFRLTIHFRSVRLSTVN